jgi:hypothetical protein
MYEIYNLLDPSGQNTKLLKEKYDSMSNADFFNYHYKIGESDILNYRYYLQPYDNQRATAPAVKHAEKALDALGEPLFERITLPHVYKDPKTGKAILSKEKFMVGPLPQNILQQQIFSEAKATMDEEEVDPITGAVKGSSKGGRLSNTNIANMMVRKTEKTVEELLRFRSDNPEARREIFNQIVTTGVATMNDKEIIPEGQLTKNYINEITLGMHLKTNLVDDI